MQYYWDACGRILWSPTDYAVNVPGESRYGHLFCKVTIKPSVGVLFATILSCYANLIDCFISYIPLHFYNQHPKRLKLQYFVLYIKFKIKFLWRHFPCQKSVTRNPESDWGKEKSITCNFIDLHVSRLEKEPSKITDRLFWCHYVQNYF